MAKNKNNRKNRRSQQPKLQQDVQKNKKEEQQSHSSQELPKKNNNMADEHRIKVKLPVIQRKRKNFVFRVIQEPVFALFNTHMSVADFAATHNIPIPILLRLNPGFFGEDQDLTEVQLHQPNLSEEQKELHLLVGFCYTKRIFNENKVLLLVNTTFENDGIRSKENEFNPFSANVEKAIPAIEKITVEKEIFDGFQRKLTELEECKERLSTTKTSLEGKVVELEKFILSEQDQTKQLTDKIISLERSEENLTSDKIKLALQNELLEKNISQITENKRELETSLDTANLLLERYQVHVVFADSVQDYSRELLTFFKLCNLITTDAFGHYHALAGVNDQLASLLQSFLFKYEYKRPADVGRWEQRLDELSQNGIITDQELINTMTHAGKGHEISLHFKKFVFYKVLEKYASSVLILSEELRNIQRFQTTPTPEVLSIQQMFESYKDNLLAHLSNLGLEVKYVPLFAPYNSYVRDIQVADARLMFKTYKNADIEPGMRIKEIIDYKFRIEGENADNNRTMVIIA